MRKHPHSHSQQAPFSFLAFLPFDAVQVVEFRSRIVIPLAGIIVGSSMTIAANTMQRLADDVQQRRGQVSAKTPDLGKKFLLRMATL